MVENTKKWKSKAKFLFIPYQKLLYIQHNYEETDHFCCIFAIFLYWVISFILYLRRNLEFFIHNAYVFIGHLRSYSNCMFYFHILAYKKGTNETHFVAKWQHLLHSYQYSMYRTTFESSCIYFVWYFDWFYESTEIVLLDFKVSYKFL